MCLAGGSEGGEEVDEGAEGEGVGKRREAELEEEEEAGVVLEDLETGSRTVVAGVVEEERMVLGTGMGGQGGEMRGLLRGMKGNLGEIEGMIEMRINEKRIERREEERGKAGGGKRPYLPTCRLHWLPTRRRRKKEKQISSRSLRLRRAERSKTGVCRNKMKRPMDRRVNRPRCPQMSRCRRIQMKEEMNLRSNRRLLAVEKRRMVTNIRRLLAKKERRQKLKSSKGKMFGTRVPLGATLKNMRKTSRRMTT